MVKAAFFRGTVHAATDFEAAASSISDATLRDADTVVLRVSYALWRDLITGERAEELRLGARAVSARLPGRQTVLIPDVSQLCSRDVDSIIELAPRTVRDEHAVVMQTAATDIAHLRSEDLTQLLSEGRRRCIIESADHHYSLPSGAHASKFVRIAEAFSDIDALNRAAYWLAVHFRSTGKEPRRLIVDNPSMLALALRLEALLRANWDIQCLDRYPEGPEGERAVGRLLALEPGTSCCVLVGIASTGKVNQLVERVSQASGDTAVDTVILYCTQELSARTVLCDLKLDGYRHFPTRDACELCLGGSTAVPIDPNTYSLRIGEPKPVALPPQLFAEQRIFVQKYGQAPGVLRVHYRDPNESVNRHHAFYVDVASLLKVDSFRAELATTIAGLSPLPDLILGPEHAVALELGRVASETLQRPFFAHNTLRIGESDGHIASAVAKAKALLVLDDLFISGRRFDLYNRALREQRVFDGIKNVTFFTTLALPESHKALSERRAGFQSAHGRSSSFVSLYTFCLPNWHKPEQCPWCSELTILRGRISRSDDLDTMTDLRLATLTNVKDGLTDECLYSVPGDPPIPAFARHSPAIPEGFTPLQVVFMYASAVQQLRTQGYVAAAQASEGVSAVAGREYLDCNAFPVPRVLAAKVIEKSYTERLAWLGLMRALKPSETSGDFKCVVAAEIASVAKDPTLAYMRGEMAVEMLLGHAGSAVESETAAALLSSVGLAGGA